jgi:hypothetical protein
MLWSLTGAGSAALWTLGATAEHSQASAAAAQRVAPTEPLAKALGYEENASKVDRSKFPTYKPGDMCDKCRFFQGKAGQAWGPCQIFMGKDVNAHGWCASFAMKT